MCPGCGSEWDTDHTCGKRIAGNQTNGDRHPRDDYATDPAWTRVLLNAQPLADTVWEPAAGHGVMAEVLGTRYRVRATSIEDGHDFLASSERAQSIVTNPPYRLLDEFVRHGLAQTDRFLCLLVSWHYVAGGHKRWRELWSATPPNRVIAVPERMTVNGKPSQFNHAWLVWDLSAEHRCTELLWRSARAGVSA